MQAFSSFDIMRILKIPKERFREWVHMGFVRPSIAKARGRGTKALFSKRDLYFIGLFRELIESGLSREAAAVSAYQIKTPYFSFSTKYILSKFHRFRDQIWVDARTGKEDPRKKDVLDSTVDFIRSEVELRSIFDKEPVWDHLIIINFAKLKRAIDSNIEE
jgi:hypothetical protein